MSIIKKKQSGDRIVEIRQVNDILFQLWVDGILTLQSMDYNEILEEFKRIKPDTL